MADLSKLWDLLSPEIKQQIFGHLASPNLRENAQDLRVAHLATVNIEWQEYFERITFQSLTLPQYHVPKLKAIVSPHRRRVEAVRHLHLRLELPRYSGPQSDKPETKGEAKINNTIFNKATRQLFSIISRWPANQGQECVFEISAHSPSDLQYRFERMIHYLDNTMYRFRPQSSRYLEGDTEPAPAWAEEEWFIEMNGPLDVYYEPTWGSKHRVVGSGLKSTMQVPKFASVKKFNTFLLRRQFFRVFDARNALNVMLDAMPNLTSFTYEPWQCMIDEQCWSQEFGLGPLFECLFAHKKLKNVTVFKSFEQFLSYDYNNATKSLPAPDAAVGHHAATFSSQAADVTTLRLCFVTDAMDFFRSFWNPEQFPPEPPLIPPGSEMRWAKLKTLVLTSEELSEDGDHDRLVCLAADAAKNMPRLSFMGIWNSGKYHGAYIIYTRDLHNLSAPVLEVGSSWGFRVSDEASERWDEVVEVHQCRYPLELEHADYPKGDFSCYSTLACSTKWPYKGLFGKVATETTLKEMKRDEQDGRY